MAGCRRRAPRPGPGGDRPTADDDLERLGFDQVFRRMWQLYLCYAEAGFRSGYLQVSQFVLTRALTVAGRGADDDQAGPAAQLAARPDAHDRAGSPAPDEDSDGEPDLTDARPAGAPADRRGRSRPAGLDD